MSRSRDEEEGRKNLLRGVKRLQSIKLTCTSCGSVRVEKRGYPIKLWKLIVLQDKLPPTTSLLCEGCCKTRPHFVDWPEEAKG